MPPNTEIQQLHDAHYRELEAELREAHKRIAELEDALREIRQLSRVAGLIYATTAKVLNPLPPAKNAGTQQKERNAPV